MTDQTIEAGHCAQLREALHRSEQRELDALAELDEANADKRSLTAQLAERDAAERRVRTVLWQNHPHQGKYGDDDEMQCVGCALWGVVDYLRDDLGLVAGAAILSTLAERDAQVAGLRVEKADALRIKEQQRGMIAGLVDRLIWLGHADWHCEGCGAHAPLDTPVVHRGECWLSDLASLATAHNQAEQAKGAAEERERLHIHVRVGLNWVVDDDGEEWVRADDVLALLSPADSEAVEL